MDPKLVTLIMDNGVMLVIVAIFLYDHITARKERKQESDKNAELIQALTKSNDNIAKSLDLLRLSTEQQSQEFRQHDERAIQSFARINEDLIKIKSELRK